MNCIASRARKRAGVLCCAMTLAGSASAVAQATGRAETLPSLQVQEFTRRGPALEPIAAAVDFLNQLAAGSPGTRVRLPVSIMFDEHRLSIVDARLGESGTAATLRLRLDDEALGIGLADRARDLCAAGRPCVLRLVGYWRGTADGVGRLDVRRVDGLAPGTAVAVIELEAK